MKKRRSTFRTMACAAVLVMACVVRMASANACVVAGAHYQLTADVVDWSMTVGPDLSLMMMPRDSSLRKQSRVLCASLAMTGVLDPSGLS